MAIDTGIKLTTVEQLLQLMVEAQKKAYVKPTSIGDTDIASDFIAGKITPDETLDKLLRVGYSISDITTYINSLLK